MTAGNSPASLPSAPLHVLVVHNRYRSAQPSGEDRVVDQETALLAEAGHRIRRFERRSDDIADASVLEKAALPLRVPWNRATRVELAAYLRAERPDVVHVHNTFPLLSPSVVAACTDAGVPAVATLHNYTQVCPRGTLYRDGRVCTDCVGRLPAPAVRHGCYRDSSLATIPLAVSMTANRRRWWSGVTRFFCISAAQRDTLIDAGMPAGRLTVKHNFVPEPSQRRYGDGRYLLYLGRLAEEKGLRDVMAAWDRPGDRPGLPLVLAGTGPLEGEISRWAGEREDVRYLGLRRREDCAELIAGAAAVLAPSSWQEPFGLVVVEAAAAGVPAVAAAHGAFPELITHGHSGLLHAPGDAGSLATALRAIGADPAANRAMGAAARARYEQQFTPAAGLARLVDGYREAITAVGGGNARPEGASGATEPERGTARWHA